VLSGVELGVQGGYFSRWILDKWQACTEYHLVDLWETQKNYIDLANCNQEYYPIDPQTPDPRT